MKCSATELEIETLNTRIKDEDIDLQPDFQRGEVWSPQKKRKLIDSILRGWRIPPVHVIENKLSYVDEVLDGQQRLATIRDFMNDAIKVDGNLQPFDKNINLLDGLKFSQLELDVQRKFKKYSVTIIRLTEYTPEEPAELFYRLNQPASLTSAEQRNAFIGDTRNQIKNLVEIFESVGADKDTIGFSNSRMAYDDVLSKFCFTLESKTIKKKITSTEISNKYRHNNPFPDEVFEEAKEILTLFVESIKLSNNSMYHRLSLNKATLFSWLLFVKRHMRNLESNDLSNLIYKFERAREVAKGKTKLDLLSEETFNDKLSIKFPFYNSMLLLFNQRASMGSTDATSIIYRDIILEMFNEINKKDNNSQVNLLNDVVDFYNTKQNFSLCIENIADRFNWGATLK
jgi:hypothetical protein